MKKCDVAFAIIVIIVGSLSYLFGHFPNFIWVFLATLFGFYTSLRLVKYSEGREKRKELRNLLITKQNILQYLKEEIKNNISYMKEFEDKFNEALKNQFRTFKAGWGNIKTSFCTTDIWNRFVNYFDDFDFIKTINDEYNKYIAIHKATEVFWDKVYEMVEKYAVDTSTYGNEVKKIQTRYALLNLHIHKCIGKDESSEKCLEAIKEKIKENELPKVKGAV